MNLVFVQIDTVGATRPSASQVSRLTFSKYKHAKHFTLAEHKKCKFQREHYQLMTELCLSL